MGIDKYEDHLPINKIGLNVVLPRVWLANSIVVMELVQDQTVVVDKHDVLISF